MCREESSTSNNFILNVEGLVHLNASIRFFKIIFILLVSTDNSIERYM